MKVLLPDTLAMHYDMKGDRLGMPIEEVITKTLERFKDVDVTAGAPLMVLDGKALDVLQTILRGGTLQSPADLCEKVQRLASVEIGEVRVNFTPGQLEELANRAERNGISVEEATRRVVRQMEASFFDNLS